MSGNTTETNFYGEPGNTYVVMSAADYANLLEILEMEFGSANDYIEDFVQGNDGNYYALKSAVQEDDFPGWIEAGFMADETDLEYEFITLSTQANIFN